MNQLLGPGILDSPLTMSRGMIKWFILDHSTDYKWHKLLITMVNEQFAMENQQF
jgi:hypothetical protein